jgi:hypothetical protein
MENIPKKEIISNTPSEVTGQIPTSQRKLVTILLILVLVLLGVVMYFLIKDEILDIPFINTKVEEIEKQETSDVTGEEEIVNDQTETNKFSVFYSSTDPDSTEYSLKTILPDGAEILDKDTASTKIEFNNSYLKFTISHISVPETVKSYADIDDGKLASLFRVVDQSDHIYYTGNLRTDEDCVEVGAIAPCGSLAVELDNGNNETVYINVEFVGDDEDLIIADDIVANLEFVSEKN